MQAPRVKVTQLRYSCLGCEKTFKRQGHVRRHVRDQKDELHKEYWSNLDRTSCANCGKNFKDSAGLKRHQKSICRSFTTYEMMMDTRCDTTDADGSVPQNFQPQSATNNLALTAEAESSSPPEMGDYLSRAAADHHKSTLSSTPTFNLPQSTEQIDNIFYPQPLILDGVIPWTTKQWDDDMDRLVAAEIAAAAVKDNSTVFSPPGSIEESIHSTEQLWSSETERILAKSTPFPTFEDEIAMYLPSVSGLGDIPWTTQSW